MKNLLTLSSKGIIQSTIRLFILLVLIVIVAFMNLADAYSSEAQKIITTFEAQLQAKNTKAKAEYLQEITQLINEKSLTGIQATPAIIADVKSRISTKQQESSISGLVVSTGKGSIKLSNIDLDKIRSERLTWHNIEREKKGLSPLSYHMDLERTANERSSSLANKYTGHQREGMAGYYNYNGLLKWFADRKINFSKQTAGKILFSESIGYRYYKCSNADCTQKLLDATKKVFDAYLKEGNNGIHYRAIVMPYFSQMGIGLEVNPKNNMVYVTIHYSVDINN